MCRSLIFNGEVMSRDVPICNTLAICREVLNIEHLEVLQKCLFWDCGNILQN